MQKRVIASRIIEELLGALLLAILVLVSLQVLLRGTVRHTLPWADEIVKYVLVWLTFVGAIPLFEKGKHLSVGIKLQERLGKNVSRVVDSLVLVFLVCISVIVVYNGFKFCKTTWNYYATSLPWLKMGMVFLALPISAVAMTFYLLRDLLGVVGN